MVPETAHGLARLGYGARPGEADQPYLPWLDAQLAPPPGDDPALAAHLARTKLHIKYAAKDGAWPAMDEDRPLQLLDKPIEALWPRLDHALCDGAERRRPLLETIAATIIRACHSDYPLRENLCGFWHDHFNVNAWDQEQVALALPRYDRDVIARHCLGNFRAMLEAVAGSTAMLYYLSNRSSRAGSANENYARELFELHTLGRAAYLNDKYDRWREVPGAIAGKPMGYIDQDVYEAARALTGWTVEDGSGIDGGRKLPNTGRFAYVESWHDGYQKRVLGTEFDAFAPALADGRKVLDLVSAHPATARFLCTKLIRRYVGPAIAPSLLNAATQCWTRYHDAPDQIARVMRVIATSPEFQASAGQKLRRPLALVAAFIRATGIEMNPTEPLINEMANAGQRLFGYGPPTGLPDEAQIFLGTNNLRRRWLIVLALGENWWGTGRLPSGAVAASWAATPRQALDYWLSVCNGRIDPAEQDALLLGLGWPADRPLGPITAPETEKRLGRLAGLVALTPHFQSC